MTGRVGPVARALGFAGLLPQVAAVAALSAAVLQPSASAGFAGPGAAVALIYPLVIFSFLGGMWWGLGMRAEARQPCANPLGIILISSPRTSSMRISFRTPASARRR